MFPQLYRKKFISNYLSSSNCVCEDLGNMISDYDFYLKGKSNDLSEIIYCDGIYDDGRILGEYEGIIKIFYPRRLPVPVPLLVDTYDFFDSNIIEIPVVKSPSDGVSSCKILSDDRIIIGCNGVIKIFNINSKNCDYILKGHELNKCITHIKVIANIFILSKSDDKTIKIWNTNTKECITTLKDKDKYEINNFKILPDYKIITSSNDSKLTLWYTQNLFNIDNMSQSDISPSTIEFVTWDLNNSNTCILVISSKYIVTGSNNGTLKLWNLENIDKKYIKMQGHIGEISCIKKLFDGRIVSGSHDGTLKIWDIESGKCEITLRGHSGKIGHIKILPDGQIISSSFDNTLRIWNPFTGNCNQVLTGHKDGIWTLNISPQGFIISTTDGDVKIWY